MFASVHLAFPCLGEGRTMWGHVFLAFSCPPLTARPPARHNLGWARSLSLFLRPVGEPPLASSHRFSINTEQAIPNRHAPVVRRAPARFLQAGARTPTSRYGR